jgi:rhamnosyltransferase
MIISIIVLYKPDKNIFNRLKQLAKSSNKVIVILNQTDLFGSITLNIENTELVILGENIGLAKALNVGIKKAMNNQSCEYVALFDQDSFLDDANSISNITAIFEEYINDKIGIIGHSNKDVKLKFEKKNLNFDIEEVEDVITSGSVIPCHVLKNVGLMDENLFIDYIDYEWCLRAKSFGYKIYKSNKNILSHNLGDKFIKIFGLRKPIHTNPIRKYYIIRNTLILLNRNYITLSWKTKHFLKLLYRIPGYFILSNNKFSSLKIIIKSFYDFYKNRRIYKTYKF